MDLITECSFDVNPTESYKTPSAPNFSRISEENSDVLEPEQMDQDVDVESASNLVPMVGYKLVGDNIDKNVRSRYSRQDKPTLSMHFYHSYAVCDRTSIAGLSEEIPNLTKVPLLSIPVNNVLPSNTDQKNLLHNFTLLTSRLLVENFKYFRENYSDAVQCHIQHDFYDEMSKKSTTVGYAYILVSNVHLYFLN